MHYYLAFLLSLTVHYYSGGLAYYSPSVMERVIEVRIKQGYVDRSTVDRYNCFAASLYTEVIGDTVLLTKDGETTECLIVDVSREKDKPSIRKKGIIIEVDYNTAKRLKCLRMKPSDCKVSITVKE